MLEWLSLAADCLIDAMGLGELMALADICSAAVRGIWAESTGVGATARPAGLARSD